jgi:hypothetical protein
MDNSDVGITPTEVEGIWVDEFGKNNIEFEKDEEGTVTAMVIHSINRFARQK